MMRWYDSDEIRAILAEPPFYTDDDTDEARTDALIEEQVQLDLANLERWLESRDRSDPFCVEVGE